jgi:hypothetical protein
VGTAQNERVDIGSNEGRDVRSNQSRCPWPTQFARFDELYQCRALYPMNFDPVGKTLNEVGETLATQGATRG